MTLTNIQIRKIGKTMIIPGGGRDSKFSKSDLTRQSIRTPQFIKNVAALGEEDTVKKSFFRIATVWSGSEDLFRLIKDPNPTLLFSGQKNLVFEHKDERKNTSVT
jgi:hypothetical protein